ncbi:hypothetical protein AGMMS49975_09220 [Clostridia bacterium]|nr:hypothetical protein AGMMS49975_09220 [Clostridia bacterium]
MAENIFTSEDLKKMQSWDFEHKIHVTQIRILEFYGRMDGKVTVSFSGGKDSTVLLDLARRCFPDTKALYVDTGLEFPEVRNFALSLPNVIKLTPEMRFDEVIKEYGWCYPSKDVANAVFYARQGKRWAINYFKGLNTDGSRSWYKEAYYKKWAFLLDSDFKISAKCCDVMKENPLKFYAQETKTKPITGTLTSESSRRKQAWLKTGCNSFKKGKEISKPLSFWSEQDILRYLRDFKIPYASVYGDIVEDKKGKLKTTGERRTGCTFCPIGCHLDKVNTFQRLEYSRPARHRYIINDLGLGDLLDFVGVDYGRKYP